MISIEFDDLKHHSPDAFFALGRITLGEHVDWFRASLMLWNRRQYRQHWEQSLRRIVEGEEKSALITDVSPIETANFLTWWPMWSEGGVVYIQNHLLFFDDLNEPFELSRFYDFVPSRETHSEDGGMISQWSVLLSDIAQCWSATDWEMEWKMEKDEQLFVLF